MPLRLVPDSGAQFRDPPGPAYVYMGGTAMSCGQHPSLPKEHRWGPWRTVDFRHRGGGVGRERTCKVCALVSDIEWRPRSEW